MKPKPNDPTPDPHEQVGSCTDNGGREAEKLDNLKTAFDRALWAGWSIDGDE